LADLAELEQDIEAKTYFIEVSQTKKKKELDNTVRRLTIEESDRVKLYLRFRQTLY